MHTVRSILYPAFEELILQTGGCKDAYGAEHTLPLSRAQAGVRTIDYARSTTHKICAGTGAVPMREHIHGGLWKLHCRSKGAITHAMMRFADRRPGCGIDPFGSDRVTETQRVRCAT
jgi:hypothetical protein